MSQSLVKNYIHIVFSTKHRQPFIHPPIEDELHAFIGGVCLELGCSVLKVGGYMDHIHILCMLSEETTIVQLLRRMKSTSSQWIKTKGKDYKDFYWQNGYGAFSVDPGQAEKVVDYIRRQHEHHLAQNFQNEYRALLKEHGVDYDERYIWD